MKKKAKKNMQDATLKNTRTLKRRIEILEQRADAAAEDLHVLFDHLFHRKKKK